MTLACGALGNYITLQQQNSQYYCVDRDGFAVSPLTDNKDMICKDYIYYEKVAELISRAKFNY
jgi:hypothetical protein